jgi:superfamily II DNA or RNA helicase
MKLILETPTILRIAGPTDYEIHTLKDLLKYKDNAIEQEIRQLKLNPYWYQRFGEEWVAQRQDDLLKQLWKSLLFEDTNGYYTLPGIKERIQENYPQTPYECNVIYPEFKLRPWQKKPPYEPKEYQSNALVALVLNPHSHVEIATGLGKTLIAILLAKSSGLNVIIATPSAPIAKAIYKECKEYFGKKLVGMFGAERKDIGKSILICVGKSLSMIEGEQIEEFKKYQVLISDESHTMAANQFSYYCNTVLGHVPYRWFLSATQERNDGKDLLLEGIIGPRVYEKTIQEGIAEGHLAKLSTLIIDVESKASYSSSNATRMNQKHLYQNEQILNIVVPMIKDAIGKKMPVLVLIDEHDQEKLLKDKLGDIYAYACGGSDTDQICQDFNAGKVMCVVGTAAVSVGTNFKPVQLTINWKGSKAGTKVKQGPIGRSTRTDEASGKTSCKIVDFRVKNVPMLLRHANARIKFYKDVGPVSFLELSTGDSWMI